MSYVNLLVLNFLPSPNLYTFILDLISAQSAVAINYGTSELHT